ncbi:hypothetical protein PG994_012143 [Apiospora phragmitis]|uniref:Uncharacterized protein n=1 Tax=Apiospora phragmitis TaxID=2905665 RepID=A0ABR1TUV7_9PEZI
MWKARLCFRWHSTQTQKTENRAFRLYEDFLRLQGILPPRPQTDDAVAEKKRDLLMFPSDHQKLYSQLRVFLIFIAQAGRGKDKSGRLTYGTLTTYRLAAILDQSFPRQLTGAMRFAAQKYGPIRGGNILACSEVGLNELRQLIDHDLLTTSRIKIAEAHQLAWLLMRTCCVRPGSIGSRPHKISRGESKCMVDARVKFRSLKSNRKDPESALKKDAPLSEITCKIKSLAAAHALIFSIPHRLLVIALRRKILVGIASLDELINGQQYEILPADP